MAARDRPRGAKRQGSDSAAMSTISGSCPLNSEGGPRSTGSGTPNCVPNEQAAIAEHRSMVSRNSSIFQGWRYDAGSGRDTRGSTLRT
jgi:hypothetical protein